MHQTSKLRQGDVTIVTDVEMTALPNTRLLNRGSLYHIATGLDEIARSATLPEDGVMVV
jgi:hypothetical protein